MIFKEEVTIKEKEKKLIITISCKRRKYAFEEKKVYPLSRISDLIPENLKGKVKQVQAPPKHISNVNHPAFQLSGQWVFSIINTRSKQPPRRPKKTKTQDVS